MTGKTFGCWAIVELFGHSQIAGLVSDTTIGGQPFVRVDVPATTNDSGFTKFFGGNAVFSITPTTKEVVAYAADSLSVRPVSQWIVPLPDKTRQIEEELPF